MGCDGFFVLCVNANFMFQSTHPHGVRLYHFIFCFFDECFNPRTHMGCDTIQLRSHALDIVSIHAPTWGATHHSFRGVNLNISFNPRTHMGCDFISATCSRCTVRFQSTHPHGVRPEKIRRYTQYSGFNPRTHMGCDGY